MGSKMESISLGREEDQRLERRAGEIDYGVIIDRSSGNIWRLAAARRRRGLSLPIPMKVHTYKKK